MARPFVALLLSGGLGVGHVSFRDLPAHNGTLTLPWMNGEPQVSADRTPGMTGELFGFAWSDRLYLYKSGDQGPAGMGWRGVVRHTLASGQEMAFQLRYFEIAPEGFSSLEKHQHAHTIVVLRGRGKVVAGLEVFNVAPFDLVVIPPGTPHQFVNAGSEPFGFICPVDADRDRPKALTADELARLMDDPDVRTAIRLA